MKKHLNNFKVGTLSMQHTLAMFGSTVLVPFLTGLDVSLAIMCAGIGTLIFHFFSNFKVPVFLGSSFAFISAITLVLKAHGVEYVKGGIICTGFVYIFIASLVYFFGRDFLIKILPCVVVGPIIMVIGLRLSPVAIEMSGYHNGIFIMSDLILSLISISTVLFFMFLSKSFFRYTPIVFAVIVGYLVGILMHKVNLQNILDAQWFGFSSKFKDSLFSIPRFSWSAVLAIAPIGIVTTIEHIGDIKTNGEVVGKDFFQDPGLNKTLAGDGFATIIAGLLGGPAVTTYGENTGVLAITKIYDPKILRFAAILAIFISCIGKLSALIRNIPVPVMGGISIILFGMIASIGLRTLMSANLNFSHSRNLIIPAFILVTGIAINTVSIGKLEFSGLFIATIIGIILNQILPKNV